MLLYIIHVIFKYEYSNRLKLKHIKSYTMHTLVLRKLEWLCVSDRWTSGQGMLAEIEIYFMITKGSIIKTT